MAIEQHYQNPTTGATSFDTTLTASIRLGDDGLVEDGQLGAVGTSAVYVDDPSGVAEYLPLQRYYVKETAGPSQLALTGTVAKTSGSTTITGSGSAFLAELSAGDELVVPGGGGTEYLFVQSVTDNTHLEVFIAPVHSASGQSGTRAAQQRLWSGWTGDPSEDRGLDRPDGGEFIGAGRVCAFDLAEGNTSLHHRILRGNAGNRTATETSGTRLAAFLGMSEVSSRIHDDGLVGSYTTSMDKADYRGRFFDEAMNDLSQVDGANHSLDYHEATGHWQLIYQKPNAFYLPTPLRLSNYAADDGAALTYHPDNPKRLRQSQGLGAGLQVTGAGLTKYVTRAATADAYEWVDLNGVNTNRKKAASIIAYGNRLLVDAATPDERITLNVVIPAAQMHLCRRLRQIQVRFQNLYGWTTWQWARILRRDISHAPANGTPAPSFYEVGLVLERTPGPPPPPTYSSAQLQIPFVAEATVEAGAATVQLIWKADGDSPGSYYGAPTPKVGLIAYDDTGGGGYHTGIKFLGAGNIDGDVTMQWGFSFNFGAPSGTTMTLTLKKNGAVIGTTTSPPDPGSGLHNWGGQVTVLLSAIPVVNGDIITADATWTHAPAIGTIPGSSVAPPVWMRLSGNLT